MARTPFLDALPAWVRTLFGLGAARPAIAPPTVEDELLASVRPPPADPDAELGPLPRWPGPRTRSPAKRATQRGAIRRFVQEMSPSLGMRLDAIYNALSGMGGSNDKGAAALPDTNRTPLELTHLDVLYRFSAYGRRVVDIVPNDGTMKGWKVTDDTEDVNVLAEEEKRLQVKDRIATAWKWARHQGAALIVLVTDEDLEPGVRTPAEQLRRPLNLSRVKRLRNLLVLERSEVSPFEWEGDVTSDRFGEPRTWSISPATSGTITRGFAGGAIVHHSRCIYLAGRRLTRRLRLQNGGFDDSVLEACWDAIRNLTSVDQGAALIAQEFKLNVLKIKGLAAKETSDQAAAFYARMQQLGISKSLLNMVLVDQEEDFNTLSTPMTGFEHLDDNAKAALCAAAEIPRTRLFGDAPSGLNTDGKSGKKDWAITVGAQQETEIRPGLTRIYEVIYAQREGPTKGAIPASWDLVFEPLDALTDEERADLRKVIAETDVAYVNAGILPPEHVAKSRFGEEGYSTEMLPYDAEAEALLAEEKAANAARDALAAGVDPTTGKPLPADEEEEPGAGGKGAAGAAAQRGDAADPAATWVSLALPVEAVAFVEGLRGLAASVAGELTVEGAPHVTLLYVGPTTPEGFEEVTALARVTLDALGTGPLTLAPGRVRAFPPDTRGAVPVVLEVDAWELERLSGALLRRAAHLVTAQQHARFVAHVTLGYAASTLTEEQRGRLAELVMPTGDHAPRWTAARVEVRQGDRLVTLPLDGRADTAERERERPTV